MIALGSIILANAYPFAVKTFKITRKLLRFTIVYTLSIIVCACIVSLLSQDQFTGGDVLVVSLGLIGVVIRIGADYFTRTRVKTSH